MDLKQIKEIMAAMDKMGIKAVEIEEKDFKIKLEREVKEPPQALAPPTHYYSHPEMKIPMPHIPHKLEHISNVEASPEKKVESGKIVNSPMVGTLYRAPSPEDPVFVKVGDKVDENTIVCIIEAMKVMNEVKAGFSGTIAEIYVENASPVEFGTKLIRVV